LLSIEYFIYSTEKDIAGRLINQALVRAAKRGVKVRILIDKSGAVFEFNEYYAKALMESISKSSELKKAISSLREINETLSGEKAREAVASPLLSGRKKFDLFIAPLEKKIDKKTFCLLEIMSEKNRLNLLPELVDILQFEEKKASRQFEGIVVAEKALNKDDLKRLEGVLNRYSGAEIKLKQTKEPSDGLRVEVADLGLELSFSKSRVKADLLDFIQKAL